LQRGGSDDLLACMAMLGSDVREVFEAVIPDEALSALVEHTGFQQRERKRDALMFIRTMIVSAASGRGGRQAEVMTDYFHADARRVARSSFYKWFDPACESVMDAVRTRALHYARSQPLDLPGVLGKHVRDWHIVDSTTVKLSKALIGEYRGTGHYAALKVHKRFSVGVGTTIDYRLSEAREHDALNFQLDESWRGLGLLCDLGYASMKLLGECEQYNVRYVMRLKDSWKPKVLEVVRGTLTATFTPGTDLDVLLDDEVLLLDGKIIDVDVALGPARIPARLVGVKTPKGYCFFLTNLEPAVAPRTVADLYRVRWEIELDNKLDKSCSRLDEITARTGPAVRALVHASMVASMFACLLANHHRRRAAPPPKRGRTRTTPPIHPQAIGRMLGAMAQSIARAFELTGKAAQAEWNRFAALLNWQTDPNWRTRPSVLDQMRGWRIAPAGSKRNRPTTRAAAASLP
jgi:Transposase DDE domain